MTPPHRRRHGIQPDRVRALELLADAQDGVTEALMTAHGVTVTTMVEIIRARLARVSTRHLVASGHTIKVATLRITDAGRRALDSFR